MYVFLLNYVPLPIPPSSLEIKTPSMNKTVTLINDGEINIPKNQGLREISFEFLLPAVNCYPFAQYNLGLPGLGNYTASALIPLLVEWRKLNKPTRFIVARLAPDYKPIYFTNIQCLIEDFTFKEDAEELGFDTMCSITLKEYKPYSTKRVKSTAPNTSKPGSNIQKTRDTTGKSESKNITTKKNETIISGAKKTGDGIGATLDSNAFKIPESIRVDDPSTNSWMDSILDGVDLESIGESTGSDSSNSLADELIESQGNKAYKRPTVPKPQYKFDWDGVKNFISNPSSIMDRFNR